VCRTPGETCACQPAVWRTVTLRRLSDSRAAVNSWAHLPPHACCRVRVWGLQHGLQRQHGCGHHRHVQRHIGCCQRCCGWRQLLPGALGALLLVQARDARNQLLPHMLYNIRLLQLAGPRSRVGPRDPGLLLLLGGAHPGTAHWAPCCQQPLARNSGQRHRETPSSLPSAHFAWRV
jgi:hypothetical protein